MDQGKIIWWRNRSSLIISPFVQIPVQHLHSTQTLQLVPYKEFAMSQAKCVTLLLVKLCLNFLFRVQKLSKEISSQNMHDLGISPYTQQAANQSF